MHQLSLSLDPKRVDVVSPFLEALAWTHCRMRPEFQWDGSCEQFASMEARSYIPLGSTVSREGDEHIFVCSSEKRREWM